MSSPRRERRKADPALSDPERLYVITGDPDGSERAALDLVTMIVAKAQPTPTVQPEQAVILRLCQAPLSVAELSAYLGLPFSVVTSLLTELLAAELIESGGPPPTAPPPPPATPPNQRDE
ncbi:DUF742 domain-containing protein [Streptomyces sp. NPDC059604]|uniref:DUF742 domain-containing protein n=1 Tax=Streptomyces sp. NPDC059604 TaxID=3346881 RepID=UPI0036BFD3B7